MVLFLECDYVWLLGVGWCGKNIMFISCIGGSWFFFVFFFIFVEFDYDEVFE